MLERFERFSTSIFQITRYWNKLTADEMKQFGLKGPYALYLVIMSHYEGTVTASKLCSLCGKDKADISRAMNVLMEKGLVEKSGENNYRAELKLTEEGFEVARKLNQRADDAVSQAGGGLLDEEREVFYRTLDQIAQNLRQMCKEGIENK